MSETPSTIELMPNDLIYQVVIYKNPKDYPSKYVARRFNIIASGPTPTEEVFFSDTLKQIRMQVMERYPNLLQIERDPNDEKHIYEVWI